MNAAKDEAFEQELRDRLRGPHQDQGPPESG